MLPPIYENAPTTSFCFEKQSTSKLLYTKVYAERRSIVLLFRCAKLSISQMTNVSGVDASISLSFFVSYRN